MVYDMTIKDNKYPFNGESGYAIHEDYTQSNEHIKVYEIYTDDGQGNGDFVCSTSSYDWALNIARALDEWKQREEETTNNL